MKLALIPPNAHAFAMRNTDYQLLLPDALENPQQRNAARWLRRRGDYLILDNGMVEEGLRDYNELTDTAHEFMVNEIVLPDVYQDAEETKKAVNNVLDTIDYDRFNYMGVLQGKTFQEVFDMVHFYRTELPFVRCYGIPRHLITTLEEPDARVRVAMFIRKTEELDDYPIDIHLLGMNPTYTKEISDFGRMFRHFNVRGVDTSLPFNAAINGQMLIKGEFAERPKDYFEYKIPKQLGNAAWDICLQNIMTMKQWVVGDLP